jgi:hypothetical protein
MYCVAGDLLVGAFISKEGSTATNYLSFLNENLALLMEKMPLETGLKIIFQHDKVPLHFCQQVTVYFLTGIDCWVLAAQYLGHHDLRTYLHFVFSYGIS